jgi:Secretion system C-terminal sorting domain
MKTNFTLACKLLLTLIISLPFINTVKAQQCTAPVMTWANPVLVSGSANALGAIYKFPSVTQGVDANVTITGLINGATLTSIDDLTYGYAAAWQPIVKTPSAQVAGDSWVSFRIDFVNANNQTPHTYNCFQLSFIDIDGDNNHIKEFVATKNFTNYTVSNNTSLTVSNVNAYLQATGSLPDYPGLDTSAYNTNINYQFTDKNNVPEVRVGTRVDATHNVANRYSCGYFAPVTMPLFPLPVKYLSFDAVVNDNKVTLKWLTAQEINHSYFEVERSFDMNNFSTLGIVLDGFVVNGSDKSYQFKDNSSELQNNSMVYYRLKQIDIDGKATYSKVLAVRLKAKAGIVMQVSPNPFIENVHLRFTTAETGTAQMRITNAVGQIVLSKQTTISKGYNNIQIDGLSRLASGMYVVQLIMNGTLIDNQRLIKNSF